MSLSFRIKMWWWNLDFVRNNKRHYVCPYCGSNYKRLLFRHEPSLSPVVVYSCYSCRGVYIVAKDDSSNEKNNDWSKIKGVIRK